jgi:hypothetical protein
MPAVTADYLRLPRLEETPRNALERPVLSVTTAPTGPGFCRGVTYTA